MYYFGKDFFFVLDIEYLLEDFLKQKKMKNNKECHTAQKEQQIESIAP